MIADEEEHHKLGHRIEAMMIFSVSLAHAQILDDAVGSGCCAVMRAHARCKLRAAVQNNEETESDEVGWKPSTTMRWPVHKSNDAQIAPERYSLAMWDSGPGIADWRTMAMDSAGVRRAVQTD